MAPSKFLLYAAGNVEVPAYLTLSKKGYAITASGNDGWDAEKDGRRFHAQSVVELLGLVSMFELRGVNWAATDLEIDEFLTTQNS